MGEVTKENEIITKILCALSIEYRNVPATWDAYQKSDNLLKT
jgi:hypothetical protein